MRFQSGARLDTSQVEDDRGRSGAGFGLPTALWPVAEAWSG